MTKLNFKFSAHKRAIFKRKLKRLRKEGVLPANVYGKNIKSVAVQVDYNSFSETLKKAGETNIVFLQINSEKNPRPVLIHNVQTDSLSDKFLHVDFYQVDLKEKVRAEIPIQLKGEAPAVHEKKGMLLSLLDEVDVEALPSELPDKLDLDISTLVNVGQELKIKDLEIPKNVDLLASKELVIVKIEPLVTKEAEELEKEEKEAQEALKAQAEEKKEEGEEEEEASEKEEEEEVQKPDKKAKKE